MDPKKSYCLVCGKEFTKYKCDQKYCSTECRNKKIKKPCAVCGKIFKGVANTTCCSSMCRDIKRSQRMKEKQKKFSQSNATENYVEIASGNLQSSEKKHRDERFRIFRINFENILNYQIKQKKRMRYLKKQGFWDDEQEKLLKNNLKKIQKMKLKKPEKKSIQICRYCGEKFFAQKNIRYCSVDCRIMQRSMQQKKYYDSIKSTQDVANGG